MNGLFQKNEQGERKILELIWYKSGSNIIFYSIDSVRYVTCPQFYDVRRPHGP